MDAEQTVTPNKSAILITSTQSKSTHARSPTCSNCPHSMLSNNLQHTPPAKRFQRVRNPFEVALTERLQFPTIESPSLFQIPQKPQLSSTQFEWTIDEVATLKPVNMEPNESQFRDSPDSELEAKAQSAITSFFRDHKIVPSPVHCPLRNARIAFSELNDNTPIAETVKRSRNASTQTSLSLPKVLPKAVEDFLSKYTQTNSNANGFSPTTDVDYSDASTPSKDLSLRRKLFDVHNIIVVDSDAETQLATPGLHSTSQQQAAGHFNSSPISLPLLQWSPFSGKLTDSSALSSFGSLSAISAMEGLSDTSISFNSPNGNDKSSINTAKTTNEMRKTRRHRFADELENIEQLSPIKLESKFRFSHANKYRNQKTEDAFELNATAVKANDFTPDRSSSPMLNDNFSIASTFNYRVSQLGIKSSQFVEQSMDVSMEPDAVDMYTPNSSNTPRRRRFLSNRKNLSQSFNGNFMESNDSSIAHDEEDVSMSQQLQHKLKNQLHDEQQSQSQSQITTPTTAERQLLQRTDSGFNDMTSSGSIISVPAYDDDKNSNSNSTEVINF